MNVFHKHILTDTLLMMALQEVLVTMILHCATSVFFLPNLSQTTDCV